jgi:2'-5' RNA ligase
VNLSKCWGICTDFAEQYQIYAEMRARQQNDLIETQVVNVDPIIKADKLDGRRCVALYTFYDNWTPSKCFSRLQSAFDISFAQQNQYTIPENATNVLHFTIMQVFGFEQHEEYAGYFGKNVAKYTAIMEKVLKKYLPFKITFRGLMAIKSGLIMCGYPSIDINLVRAEIASECDVQGLTYRHYYNNIVHSTIIRASENQEKFAEKLAEFAAEWQDTHFGELVVDKFHLGESSWRMQTEELNEVAVISV